MTKMSREKKAEIQSDSCCLSLTLELHILEKTTGDSVTGHYC